MQLGNSLRKIRKEQGLTQKEICRGICAQSMLSAIENNQYIPNAELMIKLCSRLSISLNDFSLAANFNISAHKQFNNEVEMLCNNHEYPKLKNFLLASSTIKQVETADQIQAYYYYLGVSQFHTDKNLDESQKNLLMSINSAETKNSLSTLSRLGLISLAVLKAKYGQQHSAHTLTVRAMKNIAVAPYEENLNVVFYLAAFTMYILADEHAALSQINSAIDYITKHDSHYMLANCYHLIAQIAKDQGANERELEAIQRQKFLTELFHEKIDDNF
ncbi:DNA-binding helix-turn-helix protein [Liquorilactobacillus ghanensis DSM 18630]|uniref:DNA-binding helix-turn-helix protein n=1 Tax=Liquorilactobacillus ghanensis DSM 18630 TaxID=1423750 RepID=A0A0R1VJM3_9LACO|nr:helix-turn-helix transcriptional regulator [Liquorilactobacillus ghanensis]KRM06048.1 DNA-binding helix-turn-helix protein [Liquorilactobacillus ghanensis DSM 18630]